MTYMTIPSTISGGPSIFQVRMGTERGRGEILSSGDQADFLVAFYQHGYESHLEFLRPGGVLIYDTDHVKPNPEDKRFTAIGVPITSRTIESVGGMLEGRGQEYPGARAARADFPTRRRQAVGPGQGTLRRQERGRRPQRHALAFDAGYSYPADDLGKAPSPVQQGSGGTEPPGGPRSRWTATWRSPTA